MRTCSQLVTDELIAPLLAERLGMMERIFRDMTDRSLTGISGFRTKAEQEALRARGRPAAPDELSTHRTCPATGADLRMNGLPTTPLKKAFGEAAILSGLRWGGGSSRDPDTGIPSDWNHVDLGPRSQTTLNV